MADNTEYAAAWAEEDIPAENAVMTAAKKTATAEKSAYITAYADLEDGLSKNAEDVKDVKDVKGVTDMKLDMKVPA